MSTVLKAILISVFSYNISFYSYLFKYLHSKFQNSQSHMVRLCLRKQASKHANKQTWGTSKTVEF